MGVDGLVWIRGLEIRSDLQALGLRTGTWITRVWICLGRTNSLIPAHGGIVLGTGVIIVVVVVVPLLLGVVSLLLCCDTVGLFACWLLSLAQRRSGTLAAFFSMICLKRSSNSSQEP